MREAQRETSGRYRNSQTADEETAENKSSAAWAHDWSPDCVGRLLNLLVVHMLMFLMAVPPVPVRALLFAPEMFVVDVGVVPFV
jgi:hypothetical protein